MKWNGAFRGVLIPLMLATASRVFAQCEPSWIQALAAENGDIRPLDIRGIADDGSVVVGNGPYIPAASWGCFRWTPVGGLHLLPLDVGPQNPHVFGLSANGSVIVGSDGQGHAFRLDSDLQATDLHVSLGLAGAHSAASGVSADGSVICGSDANGPWRWSAADGLMHLGNAPGADATWVTGISLDGSTIIGAGGGTGVASQAFRWRTPQGMVPLTDLSGGNIASNALAANTDGSIVVGFGSTAGVGEHACRWTNSGDVQPLGSGEGQALSITGDGRFIVGYDSALGNCVWNIAGVGSSLTDYFWQAGALRTSGWTFTGHSISSVNGRYFAGWGYSPNGGTGYVAFLGHSRGDTNCDGALNNFDIEPFVMALITPDLYVQRFPNCPLGSADIDGNGFVSNFDIDPFVNALLVFECR